MMKDHQERSCCDTHVLEMSRLETATHQSLSQMSNTKPSVSYVRYDKKRKTKGGMPSQEQSLGKSHGFGSSPTNSKPDASGKFQTIGEVCYRCGKGRLQPDQKCGAINAICNKCGKKGHYAVICKKGKGFPHSTRSAYVVEASSSAPTSQTEPDFYNECGQQIYVQSHMLQTMFMK